MLKKYYGGLYYGKFYKNNRLYYRRLNRFRLAIPHAKTESAKGLTVAFGVSKEGIDFNSLDEEEVHLFFVFASPNKDSQVYLKVLARISRLIREEEFRENLFNCKTPKEVIDCIREKEEN